MPHEQQRERADRMLRDQGIGCALFAELATVTWLTGFAPPPQMGATPFRGHPAFVWYRDGHFTCLVQDAHASELASWADTPGAAVEAYVGYTLDRPITIRANLAAAFERVLAASPPAGAMGVELGAAPANLAAILEPHGPAADLTGLLDPLRRIKTDEEIAKLRTSFDLVSVGQRAARDAVTVGTREIDVWTEVQGAIERYAGRRVPLGNDCVVGRRSANIGGFPEELRLEEHDSIIVDLSTAPDGYWSDSCGTYYAGGPDDRQLELHDVVTRALEYGTSLVRPGIHANDLDAELRRFIGREGHEPHPHHGGHGVGTSVHEDPRLAPYDDTPLEAGMVIMLEPGIYLSGVTGVRLEDGLLVTPDGAERLTSHDTSAT